MPTMSALMTTKVKMRPTPIGFGSQSRAEVATSEKCELDKRNKALNNEK